MKRDIHDEKKREEINLHTLQNIIINLAHFVNNMYVIKDYRLNRSSAFKDETDGGGSVPRREGDCGTSISTLNSS